MDATTRESITWVLGTLLTTLILVGLAVRFVLLPWLREHLARPVEQVRRQVSENEYKHTPPTLPDRIEALSTDVNTLTRFLEIHLRDADHRDERLSILQQRVSRVEGRVLRILQSRKTRPHGGERD